MNRQPDATHEVWMDPLEQLESQTGLAFDRFVSFKVNQLSLAFERQWTQFMRAQAGISLAEWRLIAMLHAHGDISFAAMVRLTDMNKALCSRSMRRLESLGLIRTAPTPGDRRSITIALLPAGRQLVRQIRPHALQRQKALLSALSANERKAFYAAVDKLHRAAVAWQPGK